jgi:hypothetical protein
MLNILDYFLKLLAAMGGLLGLGLGMSFISVIELLYFFCVRHFFLRKRIAPDQAIQTPSPPQSTEMDNWPCSFVQLYHR